MTKEEARGVSPVVLAFLGDAVYSVWVRERLIKNGIGKPSELQATAARIVSAGGQSALIEKLLPLLSEEETEVFKRGRNAKKATKARSASVAEYNRSTGFEALIGYLYLTGQCERLEELLKEDGGENYTAVKSHKEFKP
ncbi:MAG: Mini-ribonuclease 3 [Clostridia bacterium]|nr:Mini-ribonuclease 3 [Clostridia bacterium]